MKLAVRLQNVGKKSMKLASAMMQTHILSQT